MKVLKKILACVGIISVLITVFVVPCFAYSYYDGLTGSLSGSVGVPFIFETNSNVFRFTGNNRENFLISGFGSIPYFERSNIPPDVHSFLTSPRKPNVAGAPSEVGDLMFLNYPVISSSGSPWYSDVSYKYKSEAYPLNSDAYFNYLTPSDRISYLSNQFSSGVSKLPITMGYSLTYNDIISTNSLPYLNQSNDYFPLSFDVSVYTSIEYISYDSQGRLERSESDLRNYGATVSYSFELAYYSEGTIDWVPMTGSAIIFNGVISDNVIFNDLTLNSYEYILAQANGYSSVLNYTCSLYPLYNAIVNQTGRDSYIRNLSLVINPAPLNPVEPSYRELINSDVLEFVDSRLGYQSSVFPSFSFSLNYFGASNDYTGVRGSFDSSRVSSGNVYLADGEFNLVNWLGDTLSGILDTPLIGNSDGAHISLGSILYVCIGAGILMLLLKLFAGG